MLTDDTTSEEFEKAATEQRAEAFRSKHYWRDTLLLWTITRESLYFWLRTPAPRLSSEAREAVAAAQAAKGQSNEVELTRMANGLIAESAAENGPDNSYYRNATIVLYLAAHTSEDWQRCTHDRKRFLIMVEKWVDEHVTTSEMTEVAEVTNALIKDAESTRAIHRPSGKTSEESGNLQSP